MLILDDVCILLLDDMALDDMILHWMICVC